MKIGEIKKESLLLIFPEIEVRFDSENDESVNNAMSELKCDPSIRSYLDSSVPAINRALCEIENAGATKVKHAVIEISDASKSFDLSPLIHDALKVVSVYQNGKAVEYSSLDSYVLLFGASSGEITVFYKSKVEKVRYVTEEAFELDLDFGVASLIPYFVASELCASEDGARARELYEKFQKGLRVYSGKSTTQSEVEAVYSW